MPIEESHAMKEQLFIELRAAEGGDDAKDLVNVQFGIYAKVCGRRGL